MIKHSGSAIGKTLKDWGNIDFVCDDKIFKEAKMSAAFVEIEKGQCNDLHNHSNCDEVLFLLEGKLKHFVEDKEIILEKNDSIYIKKNEIHYAMNIGDCVAKMVVFYNSKNRKTNFYNR